MFGPGSGRTAPPAVDVKSLHAKIGELTLENDFLEGAPRRAPSVLAHAVALAVTDNLSEIGDVILAGVNEFDVVHAPFHFRFGATVTT